MFVHLLPLCLLLILPMVLANDNNNSASSSNSSSPAIVMTSYGQLEGFTHLLNDGQLMQVFHGIPFAQPPVGRLRFEEPLAPLAWNGTRAATQFAPSCYPHARPSNTSLTGSGLYSEDCLYLNVFALHQSSSPRIPSTQQPILLIIHGGALETGTATRYDYRDLGEKYVSKGIVVVSVQYRLGVLGFASTGDRIMPGNLGFWDLRAALRWLHSEAHVFGGNPQRLTAFGYSAGAAAVSALVTSPQTRYLVSQAVQMSSSMLAQSKQGTFVPRETNALANALECPLGNSSAIKQCLRQKSMDQIHDGVELIGPTRPADVNFAKFASRTDDGHFFPREIVQLMRESPPVPTIMGHTRLDTLGMALLTPRNDTVFSYAVPVEKRAHYGLADFEQFVRLVVAKEEYFGLIDAVRARQDIVQFYTNEYNVPANGVKNNSFYLERYCMVLSDLQYIMPFVLESQLKAHWGWPLFLYEFAWIEPTIFPDSFPVKAAFHGLDDLLLFAGTGISLNGTEARAMSHLLTNFITNFVLYGNPSANMTHQWKATNQGKSMRHLLIDSPTPKMKKLFKEKWPRIEFWHRFSERYPRFNLITGTFEV